MRDEPAWASMSATFALSTCDGSRIASPGSLARTDRHAVQLQQPAHDAHVANVGDIAQSARGAAQQGGDHGLRYEVLRTADTDLALERGPAVDKQYIVRAVDGHVSRVPMSWAGVCVGRPVGREPKSKGNRRPPP